MKPNYHEPVLLDEAVDGLKILESGIYVDVTFGGGGHSRKILSKLGKDGRLLAFDQDEEALKNALDDERFKLINALHPFFFQLSHCTFGRVCFSRTSQG